MSRFSIVLYLLSALSAQQLSPLPRTVLVEKGTALILATVQPLDPAKIKAGDDVPLRLTRPVIVKGLTLFSAGTVFHGTVTAVKRQGRHCRNGEVKWQLDRITLPDNSTAKTEVKFKSSRPNDSLPINRRSSRDQTVLGQVAEDAIMGPIAVVGLAELGIKHVVTSPFRHGACSAYTRDTPLPANATVGVEIAENSWVNY
jgi:hypothetical protein